MPHKIFILRKNRLLYQLYDKLRLTLRIKPTFMLFGHESCPENRNSVQQPANAECQDLPEL